MTYFLNQEIEERKKCIVNTTDLSIIDHVLVRLTLRVYDIILAPSQIKSIFDYYTFFKDRLISTLSIM